MNWKLTNDFNARTKIQDLSLSLSLSLFLNLFQDCKQPFGHEMLSWVRLRGINAHSVSPQLAGTNFVLLGEQGHQSVSSLSRAISQKVDGVGYRTGDPPIHGPKP